MPKVAGRLHALAGGRAQGRGRGEHQGDGGAVAQPGALDLGPGARSKHGGAFNVPRVRAPERKLREAERLDHGRRRRRAVAGGLELEPGRLGLALQLQGHAAQKAGQRPPRALGLQERVGPRGVGAHLAHAVAPDPGPHQGHPGLDGLPPPCGALRVPARGGDRRPALRLVESPPGERAGGCRQGQQRGVRQLLVAEARQRCPDALVASLREALERGAPEQATRSRQVGGLDGVPQGGVAVAVGVEPAARSPVQAGGLTRLGSGQLRAENLSEERVVAVGGPAAVEDLERHAGVREGFELARRAGAVEHGVAQRRRQALEDRGSPEEIAPFGREPGEKLLVHVVGHVAVVAAEGLDACARPLLGKRQRRQVQPRGPAAGAADERQDLIRLESDAGCPQQRGCLRSGHREVGGAKSIALRWARRRPTGRPASPRAAMAICEPAPSA